MAKKFPFFAQLDTMDCGPTCLQMISKHHGKNYTLQTLRDKCNINREGVSLLGISEAAESIGLRTLGVKINMQQLAEDAPLPCIVHWKQIHFVVVHHIETKKSGGKITYRFHVADPAFGLRKLDESEFKEGWISTKNQGQEEGVALLLETTPAFFEEEDEKRDKLSLKRLWVYLTQYKTLITQLILGLLVGSGLQLIFPFLTQSVVDVGINTQNLDFIYIILGAQLMLFLGRTSVEFIRSWILLHISTRVNISILSDFFIKLMKLPLSFFDVKMFGDILQRINDHDRIEAFLTGQTLNILFSFFNLLVFGVVLAIYDIPIFLIFFFGSILYVIWVMFFLKERKKLDYKTFEFASKSQSKLVQLVSGMQEIKLNNCEQPKRWEWERLQAKIFKTNMKGLALSQYQQAGGFFINELKNIIITFLSAKAVLDGNITLGSMLSIQYIIGQLNSPIEQLINFMQTLQNASISLDRLNEIYELEDEEPADKPLMSELPTRRSITLKNVTFSYPGAGNEPVLQDVNLLIPEKKTTAIVGMSGSGKTTLLKVLLKFYEIKSGEVKIGESNLANISHRTWRNHCGIVMQEGFIFSTSIARNIAVSDENPNVARLIYAAKTANILEFVESLPLGFNTVIGAEGNGISQGQRQRILIARAVYKNPDYLFLDEATNALDANNEREILENLNEFLKDRTVMVVAHRLSTVRNADQIVVLKKGVICEVGSHEELTAKRGEYYQLVKNQLELGN